MAGRFRHWTVLISPHVVAGDPDGNGDPLFENPPSEIVLMQDAALHLDVSLRSYKAQAVKDRPDCE